MRFVFKIIALFLLTTTLQSCALFSAAGLSNQGQPVKKVNDSGLVSSVKKENVVVQHDEWNDLLQKYVSEDGMVDYKGLLTEKNNLKNYLAHLASHPPQQSWEVQELLSYYINLYNARTVDLVLENYPIVSIKDIKGVWTNGNVLIGGKKLSLGGIENSILRKMNEPRIHFAINCASISCPKLLNEAFVPHKINEQLDMVTRDFINGENNELATSEIKLSAIFNWYSGDYKILGQKDIIGFLNTFSKLKIEPNAAISYKEYNWNLNEKE